MTQELQGNTFQVRIPAKGFGDIFSKVSNSFFLAEGPKGLKGETKGVIRLDQDRYPHSKVSIILCGPQGTPKVTS